MLNERKLTENELTQRQIALNGLLKNKRSLVKKYGKDAEKVMYGIATKQAKNKQEAMNLENLKGIIEATLKNPDKADLNKDGKLSDYEKKRGAAIEKSMGIEENLDEKAKIYWMQKLKRGEIDKLPDDPKAAFLKQMMDDEIQHDKEKLRRERGLEEDLDVGHQDDEPRMLKADLYRIAKYASELYEMLDNYDKMSGEVDFPHWWQSKIVIAKDYMVSAKHYLDGVEKMSKIDAMLEETPSSKIQIGDKVKASKEYGGLKGVVVDVRGSFIVVKTKEGNESYHESDLTVLNEVDMNPLIKVGDIVKHKGVEKEIIRIEGNKVILKPVSFYGTSPVEFDDKRRIQAQMS